MEKNISSYVVTWVEFFPDFGIVTKHDRKLFGDVLCRGKVKTFRRHFCSEKDAKQWLKAFDASKLDKSYTCRCFSDRQMALASADDGYKIHYTKKQMNDSFRLNSGR